MDRDSLVFLALPIVVVAGLVAGFLLVWRRDDRGGWPWWGSPLLWLGLAVGFVVLGVVVWPWLLGGTFLFIPFVWVSRPRQPPPVDPRSNGHATSHRPHG